jgi:hypothetical protein
MGWDLESLVARLAGDVVVDADEVVLGFLEDRPVARIAAPGELRLLRPPNPPDRVVVRPFTARALKPGRPLLGLLGKELAFVHTARVHDPGGSTPPATID